MKFYQGLLDGGIEIPHSIVSLPEKESFFKSCFYQSEIYDRSIHSQNESNDQISLKPSKKSHVSFAKVLVDYYRYSITL